VNQQQYLRQVRRSSGAQRVRRVTAWAAVGATGLAAVLGVVFAGQATATGGTSQNQSGGTGDTSGGSDSDNVPLPNGDSGGWQAPDSGGSGSAHGSTGGS
jgi:hypothetical protein